MTKYFSMFAIVAAIVLAGVSFASCDKDEPVAKLHNYTFTTEVKSSKVECQETIDKVNKEILDIVNQRNKGKTTKLSETDASFLWYKLLNDGQFYNQVSNLVDDLAHEINDPELSCTIKMIEDGSYAFREKTYKASWFLPKK